MNKIQTLLGGESGSSADYNDGDEAYQKGDYKTAFNEWIPLAMQGDAIAQFNLGWMYRKGEEADQDDKEAVKWFRKSAEQADADAQYELAYMYNNGQGVDEDSEKAIELYRKAAEQGHAEAQKRLGSLNE